MFEPSSLSRYVALTRFKMETVLSVLRSNQKGGLHVLNQPQGHFLQGTHSSGLLTLSLDCAQREGLPVQCSLLQPFCSSPGLYQDVFSGFGVCSRV